MCVAFIWPGVLTLGAQKIATGSSTLFALLAVAGIAGFGVMPYLMGVVGESHGLRAGMAVLAVAFVLCGVLLQAVFILAERRRTPAAPKLSGGPLSAIFAPVSRRHTPSAPVAQWIEHRISNPTVEGSNPSGRAILSRCAREVCDSRPPPSARRRPDLAVDPILVPRRGRSRRADGFAHRVTCLMPRQGFSRR